MQLGKKNLDVFIKSLFITEAVYYYVEFMAKYGVNLWESRCVAFGSGLHLGLDTLKGTSQPRERTASGQISEHCKEKEIFLSQPNPCTRIRIRQDPGAAGETS
jgi:hypothetical protein